MKIVLVRHGFTHGNLEGTYSGWTDVMLTEDGIQELKEYKDSYDYPETDRYVSSSLTRCKDTFEILFGDRFELYETSDELKEIFFGDYENKKGTDMVPHFFDGFSNNVRTANGETLTEFTYRVVSKLETILEQLQSENLESVTVVCHSGVIKAILMFLGSIPFTEFGKIETKNGLGYVLDVDYNALTKRITLNDYQAISQKG